MMAPSKSKVMLDDDQKFALMKVDDHLFYSIFMNHHYDTNLNNRMIFFHFLLNYSGTVAFKILKPVGKYFRRYPCDYC